MRSIFTLTAETPISHHDPTGSNASNTLTFNRRRQFVPLDGTDESIDQSEVDAFVGAHPVPPTVHRIITRSASFAEFVACAFMRVLINVHGRGEGQGLFSGTERYTMLENRLKNSGIRSHSLRQVWDNLTEDLMTDMHHEAADLALLEFFALPMPIQRAAISAMTQSNRTVITIARAWNEAAKRYNEGYSKALGQEPLFDDRALVAFDAEKIDMAADKIVAEVPAVSANTIRRQLFRRPSWSHLCDMLDISLGETKILVGSEAIFENGGSIKSGASQPTNSYYLAQVMRDTFPTLDLLGGVANSFDIGESRLKVFDWIVCRENAETLRALGIESEQMQVSVFDMLDFVTHTRQSTRQGDGQMIYNFETLIPGTQFAVLALMDPFTPPLTAGAFHAALLEYQRSLHFVGGQSARGFGFVSLDAEADEELAGQYDQYLVENKDRLREAILTGTLGCDTVVVS